MKTYEELTFTDDFMFCKILEQNEDLCRDLVELILGIRIEIIRKPEKQRAIEITPEGKGVRLDVQMEGDSTVYGLEMQNGHKGELPRRGRYYQSLTDLDMMERGAKYNELKDSVLIFLCTFDPFGQGHSMYTVKKRIEEDPDFEYNDGTKLVFLSSLPNQKGRLRIDLQRFLGYMNGEPADSELARKIDAAIRKAKEQKSWRKEYMLLEEKYEEFREEGLEEGRKKGLEEGRKEGRKEIIAKMKEKGMTNEDISALIDIPLKEIELMD